MKWGLFPMKSQFLGDAQSMSFTKEDYHARDRNQSKFFAKSLKGLLVTQSTRA